LLRFGFAGSDGAVEVVAGAVVQRRLILERPASFTVIRRLRIAFS
jgi:hypothetical protein